ncbi:phosphonate transport system permease protein [Natronocella acetinitrilica]|uniref:Phosphonate transport system permease protein n=1 Tax=Natronocella acetinitrilica TaxID=414046 RepID=A0AAE3KHK9_9GAMM|nr:phosphonate transport system permease protein [Natronocella acetinitrilica]
MARVSPLNAEIVGRSVADRRLKARLKACGIGAVVLAIWLWSAAGTGFRPDNLIAGIPQMADLIGRMLPPDLSILRSLAGPLLETVQMALLGTTLPIFIALPLAVLAAWNTTPWPALGQAIRVVLATLRTVPELVWAMLLVSAIGLGPFPGVLALTLHAIGGMGKFYYEAIETVRSETVEALEASGAGKLRVLLFGILPSALPQMMSTTLLYWEFNNRSSTILGIVGAGGIGVVLLHALQDFRYEKLLTCLIVIVLLLMILDRISGYLRSKVI